MGEGGGGGGVGGGGGDGGVGGDGGDGGVGGAMQAGSPGRHMAWQPGAVQALRESVPYFRKQDLSAGTYTPALQSPHARHVWQHSSGELVRTRSC